MIIFSSYIYFFLAASLVFRVTFHLWSITRAEGHPPRLNFFHLLLFFFFLPPVIPRPLLDFDILFRSFSGGLAEYCGWLTCAEKEALGVCEGSIGGLYKKSRHVCGTQEEKTGPEVVSTLLLSSSSLFPSVNIETSLESETKNLHLLTFMDGVGDMEIIIFFRFRTQEFISHAYVWGNKKKQNRFLVLRVVG